MSYDEHLISMAGGDGDVLDAIQHRERVAADYPGMVTIEQSQADVPALLAIVREQAAKLEAINDLVLYLDRLAPGDKHYAGLIRSAITTTEPTA